MFTTRQTLTYLEAMREECQLAYFAASSFRTHAAEWRQKHREMREDHGVSVEGLLDLDEHETAMQMAVETMLACVSRLSLFVFNPRKTHQRRVAHLRSVLGIQQGHPISNRDFRDGWTHADERIDLRMGGADEPRIPLLIQRLGEWEPEARKKMIRFIDPYTERIVFFGVEESIDNLVNMAESVHLMVSKSIEAHHRMLEREAEPPPT